MSHSYLIVLFIILADSWKNISNMNIKIFFFANKPVKYAFFAKYCKICKCICDMHFSSKLAKYANAYAHMQNKHYPGFMITVKIYIYKLYINVL